MQQLGRQPKKKLSRWRMLCVPHIAKVLGLTESTLRRLMTFAHSQELYDAVKLGKGRPPKQLGLTEDQRSWITSRRTLKR